MSPRRRLLVVLGFGLAMPTASGIALASVPPTEPAAPTTTIVEPVTTVTDETLASTSEVTESLPSSSGVASTDFDLVPVCTSAEADEEGLRTFRVDNRSGEPVQVTLLNQDIGQSIGGTAATGVSTWNVPAGIAANTTVLSVGGVEVAVSDSTNLICAVVDGNAACDPGTAQRR